MKNKVILVVSHKNVPIISDSLYQPIMVNGESNDFVNYWKDNSGDNIEEKNPNYCELTALYWLWKNKISSYNIVGLVHYRRMFYRSFFVKRPLSEIEVDMYLDEYDIILPKKRYFRHSVAKIYFLYGQGKKGDLKKLANIILESYPEYYESFCNVLTSKEASYYNMFIMNSEKTASYCEWLFDILYKLEEKVDLTDYTVAEARIFGYLSEILLNVWVIQNNYKVKYCNVKNTDDTRLKKIENNLKNLVNFLIK